MARSVGFEFARFRSRITTATLIASPESWKTLPAERAEETIAEQIRLAEYIRDVGLALTQDAPLRAMLACCAEAMARHLDGALARIWTLNEAGDVLELRASAGLYTHLDGPHSHVPIGRYKIGQIAQKRQPYITNTLLDDPRIGDPEWGPAGGAGRLRRTPPRCRAKAGRRGRDVRSPSAFGADAPSDGVGGQWDCLGHRAEAG